MAEWSLPLPALAEKIGKRLEDVVRTTTVLMFQRVVTRSPVDTGRFRANWNVSYGAPDVTVTGNTDPGGAAKSQSVQSAVLGLPVGGTVYLCNTLPYAVVLEYGLYPDPPKMGSRKRGEDGPAVHVQGGFSMQAPAGMVRVTAQEFKDAVERAVNRE